MARREWIGEYWFVCDEYKTYKKEWVQRDFNLGKCLGQSEAIFKAIETMARELPESRIRNAYILDGWGHLLYM